MDRYQAGDAHGAIEDFNQALQLNPNLAEAYHRRGNARTNLRNYQRAKDFQKAADIFIEQEKNAEAYLSQGNAHYFQGNTQEAIENYTRAVEITPKRATEDFQKAAKLFSEQGDIETSQQALDALKELQQ